MSQTLKQRQIGLWPTHLVALSLGGPCPLRAGYGESDGKVVWLDEQARYKLVMRGEESWLQAGYPVQVWKHGRLVATVFPRRRRTRRGMPRG